MDEHDFSKKTQPWTQFIKTKSATWNGFINKYRIHREWLCGGALLKIMKHANVVLTSCSCWFSSLSCSISAISLAVVSIECTCTSKEFDLKKNCWSRVRVYGQYKYNVKQGQVDIFFILLSFHIKFKNNCQKVIIVGMDISGSMVHLLIVLFDSDPVNVCVRQKTHCYSSLCCCFPAIP